MSTVYVCIYERDSGRGEKKENEMRDMMVKFILEMRAVYIGGEEMTVNHSSLFFLLSSTVIPKHKG